MKKVTNYRGNPLRDCGISFWLSFNMMWCTRFVFILYGSLLLSTIRRKQSSTSNYNSVTKFRNRPIEGAFVSVYKYDEETFRKRKRRNVLGQFQALFNNDSVVNVRFLSLGVRCAMRPLGGVIVSWQPFCCGQGVVCFQVWPRITCQSRYRVPCYCSLCAFYRRNQVKKKKFRCAEVVIVYGILFFFFTENIY